jgi:hypothetical protein
MYIKIILKHVHYIAIKSNVDFFPQSKLYQHVSKGYHNCEKSNIGVKY